ncbi:ATP-dependent protease, partial [Psychrobacter sp. SIMBA_152]
SGFEFIGELALNGQLRQVTGSLAVARAIKAEKLAIALSQLAASDQGQNNPDTSPPTTPQLIVPIDNGREASRVDGVTILAAQSLKAVCDHLQSLVDPSANYESLAVVQPSLAQQ